MSYAPLPNPRSAQDADREIQDAFDLDDEHDDAHDASENTPLTRDHRPRPAPIQPTSTYDFEREYDLPPPGSPPPPSSRALPNDFGNSNGLLPTAPVAVPAPRRSLFSRIFRSVIPAQYQPVSTSDPSARFGGGTENDGVFANVTAKPQAARVIRTDDGDVHLVPEDNQKELPPTYQEAQQDAVPPYWETTVHAPAGLDLAGELIIEDLPTGSFLIFCVNAFISFFFQFVGFLLTYLLHTSHAAKFGSRAGLGLTLIQYGFYSKTMTFVDDPTQQDGTGGQGSDSIWPGSPAPNDASSASMASTPTPAQVEAISAASRDWLSFVFMTLGWFLLLSSILGFWKVKRWENTVRPAPPPPPMTAEEIERDRAVRRNLETVFGFSFGEVDERPADRRPNPQAVIDDARLHRDLRAAGLI